MEIKYDSTNPRNFCNNFVFCLWDASTGGSLLQVYVRDNKYFEDREREDIYNILKKIKNKEKITEEDRVSLVRVFNKSLDYENIQLKCLFINLDEIKNNSEFTLNKIEITPIINKEKNE